MIKLVALDADDTLWHNERRFLDTQERFRELLSRHTEREVIEQRLYETEVRNLRHYGYGVKAFTLSMIETAIELTEGEITGQEVGELLRLGREMLLAPVELLDGAAETVARLAARFDLMVLTKGDLLDQETKVARSGLGDHFAHVTVVSRKDRATYEELLQGLGLAPREFVMIGNSLRSDVVPVAEMGGHAVHVPYETTWAHETVEEGARGVSYHEVAHIREVPPLLEELATRSS